MNIENALLTLNYRPGRIPTFPVDVIVIHVTEGTQASVRAWFRNPKAEVSSHYMVTKAGQIVQFVREEDTAWHAGRVDHPTAAIVKERVNVNPNSYSIGIEHEGEGTEDLTPEQRAASVWLIADICRRRSIPMDRRHIIGHHEIYSLKTCPGGINVDHLVAGAVVAAAAPVPPSVPAVAPRLELHQHEWVPGEVCTACGAGRAHSSGGT